MQRVYDAELADWAPPSYRVDAKGKLEGAQPGGRSNWGRWGEDDQRGTANLLTAERIVKAAGLITTGERFSLALPIGQGAPVLGTRAAPLHFFGRCTGDSILGAPAPHGLQTSDDMVVLPLQVSTQLDGHAHFARNDTLYNGFWAGLVTATGGARRLGVHNQSAGIVGRGVLLDAVRFAGCDPFDTSISSSALDAVVAEQGVDVLPGDIVLVRTGWVGAKLAEPDNPRRKHSGLALDTIDWLADHDVAMVAADNPTVEATPSPAGYPLLPFHAAALCDLGLLIGELFDLDELADACAADRNWQFFFTAAPMPLVNGVGSPLNPLAIR